MIALEARKAMYWWRMTGPVRLSKIGAVLKQSRGDPVALIVAYDALQFMWALGHREVGPLIDHYEALLKRLGGAVERELERRGAC